MWNKLDGNSFTLISSKYCSGRGSKFQQQGQRQELSRAQVLLSFYKQTTSSNFYSEGKLQVQTNKILTLLASIEVWFCNDVQGNCPVH